MGFLNIVPKVTPKPAMASRNLGICFLLWLLLLACALRGKRRYREGAGSSVACTGILRMFLARNARHSARATRSANTVPTVMRPVAHAV